MMNRFQLLLSEFNLRCFTKETAAHAIILGIFVVGRCRLTPG